MNEYISNYYIRIKIEDIFKQDKSNNLIGNTAEEKYDYYMQYFFYNKRHMQLLVKKYSELSRLHEVKNTKLFLEKAEILKKILVDYTKINQAVCPIKAKNIKKLNSS